MTRKRSRPQRKRKGAWGTWGLFYCSAILCCAMRPPDVSCRAGPSAARGTQAGGRWQTASMLWPSGSSTRSEEHTSELQSQSNLVCRLLLEKKKIDNNNSVGIYSYQDNCITSSSGIPTPGIV